MEHIILRSDLASCSTIPAIKLRLSLPDPPESLIMQVPPLDDLPLYTSNAEAGVTLLKDVPNSRLSSPRVRQVNQLVKITRPFAQDMKLLKPSATHEFIQYVFFKVSFTLPVIVVIVPTVLQLVFMYAYHRYDLRNRFFPKSSTEKNAIKPVLHAPNECSPTASAKRLKRYHFIPLNIHIPAKVNLNSEPQTVNLQQEAPSSPVASQHFDDSLHVSGNTESQQEGHYGTIEQKQDNKKPPLDITE